MMTKRPNLLFFFADDQRFDTIAALGNEVVRTPNLDALIGRGTCFTEAHIPGGTVGAVCMPSRGMLHTGRTLFQLEDNGSEIPESHTLLGEVLQDAGYRTVGIGKWHNGVSSYARSFTDGGEIFFGGMTDHWNVPAYVFDPTGKYDKTLKVINRPSESNDVTLRKCDHIQAGVHSTDLFGEFASRWLEEDKEDQPFFMYVSLLAPHDPRSMPDEYLAMYDPEKMVLPENFMEQHPFEYGVEDIRDELLADKPRSPEEMKRHIAEYYGMITHLDDQLGKVIDSLKRAGKYDNTIIIFAADNGLALGQHGLMGKQSAYEHSVRVPLVMAGPAIPQGEQRDAYVYLLDIFPTICELLELPVPATVEGQSFASTLRGKGGSVRENLYFVYGDLIRGVKDKSYKLIEYAHGTSRHTQLFDLAEDPAEINNVFGCEAYAEIARGLGELLIQYRDQWGDEAHPAGKSFWSKYGGGAGHD